MISQQVPWDPLTLFQRWILRARIAEEETSGLDLGDTRMHVAALQGKVDAVQQVISLERMTQESLFHSNLALPIFRFQ